MNNARVLIALATEILGGPGKGLVQFLRHGGLEGCQPLFIDYQCESEHVATEYVRAVTGAGAPVVPLVQKKLFDPGLVEQSLRIIREQNINLLQSHGYKSHVLCWLLRRKTGLPWIAFVHGWTRENLRVRLYAALEQIMVHGADEVVAVSASLRRRLLPTVRGRCLVIPNALASEELRDDGSAPELRSRFGLPQDAVVAGVVGRLSPEKGQGVFLRALAKARKKDARLHGMLVGGGQDEGALREEARALGLEQVCVFTGHVQGLAPYYRCMAIQAMPSFSEGMPNVALEGMYMGLPLIASNVGGIPEVLVDGQTGLLVPPGDEDSLASALLRLAADEGARRAMGDAGRRRVREEFDPRVRAGRILELYAGVLSRHGGRKGS